MGEERRGGGRAARVGGGQVMLDRGNTSAGWRDRQAAESLGGAETQRDSLRAVLTDRSLAEVLQYLAAEQPQQALQRLAILAQRGGEEFGWGKSRER